MKNVNFPSLSLLVVTLLCSCSPEDSTDTLHPNAQDKPIHLKLGTIAPGNKSNAYDSAGESYREVLSEYQSGNYAPESLTAIKAIVNELTGSPTIMATGDTTDPLLSDIIQYPETSLSTILLQSELSQNAKDILSDFVAGFEVLKAKSFDDIYIEIVSQETTISDLASLTTNDKRVLLTVMSIARYSLSNKCCEDTDWETSVGNIVAATAGALISSDIAIRYTLITRIGEYELVPL